MRALRILSLTVIALGCSAGGRVVGSGGAGTGGGAAGTTAPPAPDASAGTSGAPAGTTGTAGAGAGTGGTPPRDAAVDTAVETAPPPPPSDGGAPEAIVNPPPPDAGAGVVAPVQFYGRWDFTTMAGTAITVYSGAHVTARFNGTGISALLDLSRSRDPITTVEWQIDGGAWTEGEVKATLVLAQGLPAGVHDVVFMARGMGELNNRWTPPVVASVNFKGFTVEGGALVPTARPSRLKIEFLGDSITEGVRVVPSGNDAQHTNGRLAYPCLTATALGAEWRQVGFGHQGVLQEGHGNVPKAADSFNWVYATVPRDSWVADIVVLNQGTNDRSASPTAFSPEFARYLGIIRAGYPQAQIFVLRPFGGYREAEVKAETMAKVTAGDARMFYVDTTGWLTAADYTEGLHPNIVGHQKATTQLVAELRKHM